MCRCCICVLTLLLLAPRGWAQQSYPMLMSIEPVAAQVGQSAVHVIKSRYSMAGAYRVLVSGSGVEGQVVVSEPPQTKPSEADNQKPVLALNVQFKVAAEAVPGVRDVRVVTPSGVSTVGQLVIVADPVISETADNNAPATATEFQTPATLCGRIEKAEDVDFFKFRAQAGATLHFQVRCMTLQDRIHDLQTHADPIVAVRNSTGTTLAAADNTVGGDGFLSHTFSQEGDYWLEIRDVRFKGNDYWGYCIEVNARPAIQTVFPLAATAGKTQLVSLIDANSSATQQAELTLASASDPLGVYPTPVAVSAGVQQLVRLVAEEGTTHTESQADNDHYDQAELFDAPGGINGCISAAADIDCYKFAANKGDKFTFEVFARRAGSSLDSHVRLLNEQGSQLQVNDDLRDGKRNYSDSRIENWSAPADGNYILEIRDLHLRGGAAFVYYLKASRATPDFRLYADTDKTPLTPGTSGVIFVRAERKHGFEGEIQLQVDGLPPHVSASCGRILSGKHQDGCIVLTAAADARPDVGSIRISGRATVTGENNTPLEVTREARVYQETYQPGGGRGHWPVHEHVVSIGTPADIRSVTLSTHELQLKPGAAATIEVEIERAPGFDKNVVLEVTYSHLSTIYGDSLPLGVTVDNSASTTLLTGGATRGKITLKAAPDAQLAERQQIAVMANISLNFVMKATYASQPVNLTVSP
jgi:hypothetical protein